MEGAQEKIQGIYVDLDALLDTRIATLHLVHPSLVKEALDNGYFTRKQDAFKSLDKKSFKELYDTRDSEILQNAIYTKILLLIQDMVDKSVEQALTTPHVTKVILYINTHPYKLSDSEESAIVDAMVHYTKSMADVHIFNMSEKELTPEFCLDNLSVIIKYNYAEWFDYHCKTEGVKKYPLTELTLIVPELFFNRLPTEMEIRENEKNNIDPFRAVEIFLSPLITVKTMPIEMFCLDIKKT